MNELWERLKLHRAVGWELAGASVLINFLALTSALYSTQVMNRYLSLGVDATLVALTLGALLALLFEVVLRHARAALAQWTCARADRQLGEAALAASAHSQYAAFDAVPPPARREALSGLATIQQSFGAASLTALLDAPAALLFVVCLFALNTLLGVLALLAIAAVVGASWLTNRLQQAPGAEQQRQALLLAATQHTLAASPELVRSFKAHEPLRQAWRAVGVDLHRSRALLAGVQSLSGNASYAAGILLGMLVMGLGAREVLAGRLDVGTLIGANILAGRALAAVTRLTQLTDGLARGRRALDALGQLARLPRERSEGSTLLRYSGALRFEDLAFAWPRQSTPLFERLDFELRSGGVVAVTGGNGTGKTTLAKLLAGLLEPSRGRLLADGMDLRQALPDWWRGQVAWLPQEPQFFDGTLRENLAVLQPQIADAALLDLCRELGLADFVDGSPDGLQMPVRGGGAAIPPGIRRRLALVRALAGGGPLVVLDEPTEGLDAAGCRAVAALLNRLVREGRSIVAMSNDPFIVAAAEATIDLNAKPVPRIVLAANAVRPPPSATVTSLRPDTAAAV
ncbi:MAG: ATP-binding cassette domain-containing protein [Roseateles sp.]|uniref:ATP-binding cassette domain-containing protein n=1 Tax=Roseateles sp. TaxID=1971397 RepID=UPI0039EC8C66